MSKEKNGIVYRTILYMIAIPLVIFGESCRLFISMFDPDWYRKDW